MVGSNRANPTTNITSENSLSEFFEFHEPININTDKAAKILNTVVILPHHNYDYQYDQPYASEKLIFSSITKGTIAISHLTTPHRLLWKRELTLLEPKKS